MHLNELPYTVMRMRSTLADSTEPEDATSIIRVSKESNSDMLIVPPMTVRQMNFMRPEITAEAMEYNAGDCPSDDSPSIEMEIRQMTDIKRIENQQRNVDTERDYNIASAEDMLKMKVTVSPTAVPNLVITSVQSLSTKSPVQPKVLPLLTMPSTSKGPSVTQSPITKMGETSLTISHVACGVDFNDGFQSEIDKAARSLVKGSGFDGSDLFRCGVVGCSSAAATEQEFMIHLIRHPGTPKSYTCFHCGALYDKPLLLKNHIKSHATHRYFCYCCNTTGPLSTTMVDHFKSTHQGIAARSTATASPSNETVMFPLNEHNTDTERDMFVICPRGTSSIKPFGVILMERNKTRILSTKKFYTPDEVQMLPHQAIFPESVSCQLCGYSSKIRSNIHRHLIKADCAVNANVAGTSDPVNPVPCLDTGEKHFDKMRNLAASSNSSDAAINKSLEQRLNLVPEERRFVCGARSCHYQTQTEDMLRSHIDTLHAGDEYFHCPHCNRDLAKGKAIVADDALNHFRYHGSKLFKCPACQFCHYLKPAVDKHLAETHPRCKDIALQLRPKAIDASKSNKQAIYKWKCNICSKAIFDTRLLVRTHLGEVHRLNYQYQCISPNCSYQHDTKNNVKEHILSAHGSFDNGRVKTVYERVEGEIDVTPIWRRDDPNRVSIYFLLFWKTVGNC